MGPVAFLGYVLFLAPPGKQDGGGFMTYVACGAAAAAVAARLFAPPLIVRSQRRQIAAGVWSPSGQTGGPLKTPTTDAGKLAAVYATRTIVAVAVLEGAAFFLVIAYQLERAPFALAGAVLLLVVIAAAFSHAYARRRVGRAAVATTRGRSPIGAPPPLSSGVAVPIFAGGKPRIFC